MPECDYDDESMIDDNFEFISKNWLTTWLSGSSMGPIETKHFLCVHENIDIDRLSDLKICEIAGMDSLIEEFGKGEGPRLTAVSLNYFILVQFLN